MNNKVFLTDIQVTRLYRILAEYCFKNFSLVGEELNHENHGEPNVNAHPVIQELYDNIVKSSKYDSLYNYIFKQVNIPELTPVSLKTHISYLVYESSLTNSSKNVKRREEFFNEFNKLLKANPKTAKTKVSNEATSTFNPFKVMTNEIKKEPIKDRILNELRKEKSSWTYSEMEVLFTDILSDISNKPIEI